MEYKRIDWLSFKSFNDALVEIINNDKSVLTWGNNAPDQANISFNNGEFLIHDPATHPKRLTATNYQYFCDHPEELTIWIKPEWYEKVSWENPIPVFVSNENEDPDIKNSSIRFLVGISDDTSVGKFKCCHSIPKPSVPPVTHFKYANPVREEDKQ